MVSGGDGSQIRRSRCSSDENDSRSRCENPPPTQTAPRFGSNTLLHPSAELSTGSVACSSELNGAVKLYARQGIRRARIAIAHMSVVGAHVRVRKLTVEVRIEF